MLTERGEMGGTVCLAADDAWTVHGSIRPCPKAAQNNHDGGDVYVREVRVLLHIGPFCRSPAYLSP